MAAVVRHLLVALSMLWGLSAGSAEAQSDLLSRNRFSGSVDVRAVVSDAERSWLDGGYGKTRFGTGDAEAELVLAEAVLVWSPRMTDRLSGVVSLEIQDGQDAFVDVSEAFLTLRSEPGARVRLSGRAGLYYPLISLEHDGLDWAVVDTLTPSAINAWVAEELKVVGAEGTLRFGLPVGDLVLTGGVFGYDDKAGTLLAFRGWALHDLKSTAKAELPLPPIAGGGRPRAEAFSTAVLEIDDRAGVYGRVEWAVSPSVNLSAFVYDNAGDRVSRERTEGAWYTRFTALGAEWAPDDRTRIRVQTLTGTTEVGVSLPGAFHAEVEYRSAFVAVTRDVGPGALTGRLDVFDVKDLVLPDGDNNDEQGWASTLAYRWDFRTQTDFTVEALHISSDRPSRVRLGEAVAQDDTQVQVALRRRF